MAVRRLKPITPGTRFRVANTFEEITTDKPEKSLLEPIKKSGGRNNQGKITMRYIGGGHKRRYRIIDFKRDNAGINGEGKTIEYDPNSSTPTVTVLMGSHPVTPRSLAAVSSPSR